METRSHEMKRGFAAALTAIAVSALSLTGLAPAYALTGTPVSSQTLPVARIEVPRYQNVGDNDRYFMDVCTGVLVDKDTILTVQKCVKEGQNPEQYITEGRDASGASLEDLKVGSGTGSGLAQVTFGTSSIPSSGSAYNPKAVYWVTSVIANLNQTQLVLAKLNAPVSGVTPAKILDKGEEGMPVPSKGNVYGWQQTRGLQTLNTKEVELDEPYLVNGQSFLPRTQQGEWPVFLLQNKTDSSGVVDQNGLGTNDPSLIRKGYGSKTLPLHLTDLGSPFLSGSNELLGVYVGDGIFLDMTEKRIQTFLAQAKNLREVTASTKASEQNSADKATQVSELKKLVSLICKMPSNVVTNNHNLALQGSTISKNVKTQNLYEQYKNAAVPDGSQIEQVSALADVKVGGYSDEVFPGVLEGCGDAGNMEPFSVASVMAWIGDAKADYDSRDQTLKKELQDLKDEAAILTSDREEFQKFIKGGGNRPNLVEMQTAFKVQDFVNKELAKPGSGFESYPILKGVENNHSLKSEDFKNDQYIIEPLDGINEAGNGLIGVTTTENASDPENLKKIEDSAKKVSKFLVNSLASVNANIALLNQNIEAKTAEADLASEDYDRYSDGKNYLQTIEQVAENVAQQAVALANTPTKDWKDAYDGKALEYLQDYINNYFKPAVTLKSDETVAGSIKYAEAKRDLAETARNQAQVALESANALEAENPSKPAAVSEANKQLQAAQADYSRWNDEVEKRNTAYSELEKPSAAAYVPDFKSGELGKAQNALIPHLLWLQHLALQATSVRDSSLSGADEPDEIRSVGRQVDQYLEDAGITLLNVKAAWKKLNSVQQELVLLKQTAPEAMKGRIQALVDQLGLKKLTISGTQKGVEDAIARMKEESAAIKSTTSLAKANEYLSGALKDYTEVIVKAADTADNFVNAALQAKSDATDLADGREPGKGRPGELNDAQKAQLAAADKAKAEYEQKLKDLEAKQKAAEAQATKKAEAEKKAAEEAAKNDQARLAKALSINTSRVFGDDRTMTSIAAWKAGNFTGDSVIIVDGKVAADGLSATPLAAALSAPILLTTWTTGLEPAIMDQLKYSGKKHVYLVGGNVRVSPNDEFELNEAGMDVIRIAGLDRYDTSVKVNQAALDVLNPSAGVPLQVYVGDGIGYADALAAGAAAGRNRGLTLLSRGSTLDPSVSNFINNLGTTRPVTVNAVGGPAVQAANRNVLRTPTAINPISGADRYETAALLASTLPATSAAVLASGETFADALPGGALAANQNAALVLTRKAEIPKASYEALQRHGSNRTVVVGGEKAVAPKVAELVNGAKLTNGVTAKTGLDERQALEKAAAEKAAQAQADAVNLIKEQIAKQAATNPSGLAAWMKSQFSFLDPTVLADIIKQAQSSASSSGSTTGTTSTATTSAAA